MQTTIEVTPEAAAGYPAHRSRIPAGELRVGRYALRFARRLEELRAVQRLRYRVFNEELGEGLASSERSGLDEDAVDARCHHLLVIDTESREVVGTYRVMLAEMAGAAGFYSEAEFELGAVPDAVLRDSVEAGRACVAREHRNGRVVQLLWRGLASYLVHNRRRFLFGCCSVPSLDPTEMTQLARRLAASGAMHEQLRVRPTGPFRCPEPEEGTVVETVPIPPLFSSYLKLGAKVLSGPALDREFRVTDFFVLLDVDALEPHVRRAFIDRGALGDREDSVFVA